MGIVVFTVGFIIFSTYIFFYVFNKRVEDKIDRIKNDDNIDYDGHGNWGRFPPEKDSQS